MNKVTALRFIVVILMLFVVGLRFERTIVALAVAAVFVGLFFLVGWHHPERRTPN